MSNLQPYTSRTFTLSLFLRLIFQRRASPKDFENFLSAVSLSLPLFLPFFLLPARFLFYRLQEQEVFSLVAAQWLSAFKPTTGL